MDMAIHYLSYDWEKRTNATMEAPMIFEQGQTVRFFANPKKKCSISFISLTVLDSDVDWRDPLLCSSISKQQAIPQ